MEYKFSGLSSSGSGSGGGATQEDTGLGHALSDFLLQLEGYSPSIPDAVIAHYLNSAGFESQDPRLIRLIAIASQKFLSDIVNDALQHCKTRTNNQQSSTNSKGQKLQKEKKYVMTMDDLVPALQEYGISAKKPHYFV